MASTTFVDRTTVIYASWLQDVNDLVYSAALKAASAWIATAPQPGVGWMASGAAFAVGSTNGGIGITGAARTSDSADSGTPAAIGLLGFGYNDDTYAKPTWGAYFEGKSASGSTGFSCGFEVDSVNNRSFLDADPYTAIGTNTAVDIGQWIAAGGDPATNPTAADSTWGLGFVANGAKWGKGIVFKSGSLRVRSLGAYSTQVALEMAQNQALRWINPDGTSAAWVACSAGAGQTSMGVAFISGALRIVDEADAVQVQVAKTASATSFVNLSGSATNIPTIAAASDSVTDIDLAVKSAGTGDIYLGAATVQAAVLSTASATSYVTLTGSSASTPTIGASAGSLRVGSPLLLASGILNVPPRTITGATDSPTGNDRYLICNRAGTITLTLPAASGVPGLTLTVRTITANTVVSASSNVVPLAGGAAGTAILAATAGKWAELVSDGTNWQIMAGN